MIRLFVALALPAALKAQLAMLAGGIPGAKWVPPENYHLTLRFIGEVDRHRAEDIAAALGGLHASTVTARIAGAWGELAATLLIWGFYFLRLTQSAGSGYLAEAGFARAMGLHFGLSVLASILAYPLVVGLSRVALGVHKPGMGEVDARGRRF